MKEGEWEKEKQRMLEKGNYVQFVGFCRSTSKLSDVLIIAQMIEQLVKDLKK